MPGRRCDSLSVSGLPITIASGTYSGVRRKSSSASTYPGSAQLAELLEQPLVDELLFEQLEHDPLRRQAVDETLQQKLARDVDPRPLRANHPLQPDLSRRAKRDPGRRQLTVIDHARLTSPSRYKSS